MNTHDYGRFVDLVSEFGKTPGLLSGLSFFLQSFDYTQEELETFHKGLQALAAYDYTK